MYVFLSLWMKSFSVSMKAIEQCFPVVLFIMLYKVVLGFDSMDEIIMCDDSNMKVFLKALLG